MNNYPQKKIMTFNKFTDDFDFAVNVNNLDHLTEKEVSYLGGYVNLTADHVTGVAAAFEKNTADNIETKGIKAHFNLDDSGILNLETTGEIKRALSTKKPISWQIHGANLLGLLPFP